MASISDNWDRANNDDLGANWAEDLGGWSIAANALRQTTIADVYTKCRWVGTSLDSDNYEVEVDGLTSGLSRGYGAFGRGAVSAAITFYAFMGFGTDSYYLVEITAGVESIMATGGACPDTLTNPSVRCDGSAMSGYVAGVLNAGPVTDTSLTTGAVGHASYSTNGGSANQQDNFAAADLAAGAPAVFPPIPASRILKTAYSTLVRMFRVLLKYRKTTWRLEEHTLILSKVLLGLD